MKQKKLIKRIHELINRIDAGESVTRSSLERTIGKVGLKRIDSEWEAEQKSRSFKPKEIVEYSNRVKRGLVLHSIAEGKSLKRDPTALKTYHKAEYVLENALEFLKDVTTSDSSLRVWIDRDLEDVELCPIGIPRPIWSTSPYKRDSITLKSSKREITRQILEKSLEKLQGKNQFELSKPVTSSRRVFNESSFTGFKF